MRKKVMSVREAARVSGLSEEQVKEVQTMALRTWDAIAYDCLTANDGKSISREEVVELVLDADRMTTHGNGPFGRRKDVDPVIMAFLKGDLYEVKDAIITAAFPYSRYGL